jgi:hypothetical protein
MSVNRTRHKDLRLSCCLFAANRAIVAIIDLVWTWLSVALRGEIFFFLEKFNSFIRGLGEKKNYGN